MDLHESESRTHVMSNDGDDDGYIDLEVNLSSSSSSCPSSSSFFTFNVTSSPPPPQSREFEFQMCSTAVASGESTTSPADELFYKGQLLPLHLPPRLKMVQKLLLASSSSAAVTTDTPISPRATAAVSSSPRRFSSSEIGQDEQCYFEISTELKRFIDNNENHLGNSWSKKIKQSSITQKLKASSAYLRALFSKPGCSDSSEINPRFKTEPSKTSRKKKNPFVNSDQNPQLIHRRSFSGVIQRHSQAKCSTSSSSSSSASSLSSSFSFGSNGSLDLQTLMRSSNASDNSIEGAIEHCKQSFTTRKSNVAESELCSSRTSVSTCGDLDRD
ncbi:PREDICTED: probable membrane-associated kinase regulator 3 [Camelina sativa]|uniref:Probable membrane-associated kinase regulator 3 n=1 Tax=Camelina sativa TaxID=90675 RepID=A0ABM0ZKG5_CAMSA|nr:PREDICTED: probable membrane-associated kinase regulator 3 [Camelina sativa]